MKCPNDQTDLHMTDRQGIEIDYCPQCRGVWLDRGELDKIIERGSAAAQPPAPTSDNYQQPTYQERPPQQHKQHYPEKRHFDDDDDYRHGHHKKRKKEGFLGELFDF